jgi:hypothetical protein
MPVANAPRPSHAVPAAAGIGLRGAHYRDVVQSRPAVGWLEVHTENYFGGGAPLYYLERARELYPLSLHGVSLSLGSTDPLNLDHLKNIKRLVERFEPGLVSDHLCFSSIDGIYLNDLLPLPYNEESLNHFVARVGQAQDFLGRQILVENPSSYLEYQSSTLAEAQFLNEVARRSGCGLLLDVNNVYVSSCNHDFGDGTEPRVAVQGRTGCGLDAREYLKAIDPRHVREIHLAGYSENRYDEGTVLIDTHNRPVYPEVWQLYRETVERLGPIPTLIEWDSDLPALAELVGEADKAQTVLNEFVRHAACA